MKRKCAQEAVSKIKDGMIIGLGGGSTVAFMIQEIKEKALKVQAVTPSMQTEALCLEAGIPVLPLSYVDEIDLAFDGCDELDHAYNALKSCGGIHTREKLVAAMAKEYWLLVDESKYFETLPFQYPVTVEVLPSARAYVKKQLTQMGAEVTERMCANKTGLTITDDGNYLMEAKFASVEDVEALNNKLNAMNGIVGHGLFYQVATNAIIVGQKG